MFSSYVVYKKTYPLILYLTREPLQNEDATTGESETTQPAPVLNRISESNETAGAATADNKENTQPMAQALDEGEVFRGRRVSQFDLPAKKM